MTPTNQDQELVLPSPAVAPRIMLSEVIAIARVSRVTIQRRVIAGKFPNAIDRGREMIFERRAVYEHLGIRTEGADNVGAENPWERGAHAIAERRAAGLRHHEG
ncbi:MAG: hypothetical protein WDM91_11230 [Rhizomicrobium sp.]